MERYQGIERAGYRFSEVIVPNNHYHEHRDMDQYIQEAKAHLEHYHQHICMDSNDLDETCLDLYDVSSEVDEILNSLLMAKDWDQYAKYWSMAYALWDDLQAYANPDSRVPIQDFLARFQSILSLYKAIEKA